MSSIEDIIVKEKPTVTLVHGDVNSTLAAALVSARHRIPVAHIEAGLRTPFMYNPEEINRKLTDHVSEILFPHIQEAYDSLMCENFPPDNVFLVGDIVKDTLMYTIKKFNIVPKSDNYCVATIHRAENIKSKERMSEIISGFLNSGERIVLPIHPHTRNMLKKYGMLETLKGKNVQLIDPLGYKDFIYLLANSKKVITDSGGVRREAYILGKPVIVAVEIVWVHSMIKYGWSVIAGANRDKIAQAIQNFEPPSERPEIFGDGKAAERIVDLLIERYG